MQSARAKVVIIDDYPEILDYLATLLDRAGYAVAAFDRAAAALDYIARHAVDLVITDIFMPELDGFEVLKILQRDHPELPLVAISGGVGSDVGLFLNGIRHLGARAAFSKPIDAAALLGAIACLLGAPRKG